MRNYREHLILKGSKVKEALTQLNKLASDAILFVIDEEDKLIGSLTDGDVRRGLLRELTIDNKVEEFTQNNPKSLRKKQYGLQDVIELKRKNLRIIPILNDKDQIEKVINFRYLKSYLPVDSVIMAGGRGSRLSPLTDTVPKPLLKIGEKPIIEHNIDQLRSFGIDDFWISLRYLGEQLEAYFGNGDSKGVNINYIWENEPLGTIGAVKKIQNFQHDYVLISNSDLLTTIDYEDFFLDFIEKDADMSVASIPYQVSIPYAVLETKYDQVVSFKEKPSYTYFSNGGIYLVKRMLLDRIPLNTYYDSTDFMDDMIKNGFKIISYPIHQYWLDIGKMEDFHKAQKDVNHLNL